MTPQWQIGSALMLGCFLAGPSLAEIVNVSIDGTVSGNEDVECFAVDCTGGSSNFFNQKSQLGYGLYALSGSGSVMADGLQIASGSAQQTAETTSSGFSVDLKSDANYVGGSGMRLNFSDLSNALTLSFHLTQPSILDLNGSLNATCSAGPFPASCLFLNPSAAESIDLSGSGFDFNQQADVSGNDPVNFSSTLNAGDYTLTASSLPFASRTVLSDASFEISLNADFTSAVPEPSTTVSVPVLFLAVLCGASLSKRRRTRSTA